jgi:protein-tyrosine phosphatase
MIDTHCHLLPAVDDGPGSEAESLELAGALARDGVDFVLCTPHYSRKFATDHGHAVEEAQRLEAALALSRIELKLGVAAEVSSTLALSADLGELSSRSIAGRFLLVELEPSAPSPVLRSICVRLAKSDLLPIFAHPERCRAVQRRPDLVDAARADGALVQVVAPSVTRTSHHPVAVTAWRLLATGRADLLASDAHGRIRPSLGQAAGLVLRKLGEPVRDALVERRPRLVIDGVHPAESS